MMIPNGFKLRNDPMYLRLALPSVLIGCAALSCATNTPPVATAIAVTAGDTSTDSTIGKAPDAAPGADASTVGLPKVDFLWVIERSSSMCSTQVRLAKGIEDFTVSLQKVGVIDVQMAVVSTQQVSDVQVDSPSAIAKVGQFLHKPATQFPPSCIERFEMPCTDDNQCLGGTKYTFQQNASGPASSLCADATGNLTHSYENPYASKDCGGDPTCGWRCHTTNTPQYLSNDNCSTNGYCWRHCTSDQECRNAFEAATPADKRTMVCVNPGGATSAQSGCQFPPKTADCPPADQLPAVLKGDQLKYLHCNVTVGVSQTSESGFRGGLRSAWLALDPNGPNCPKDFKGQPTANCQYQQLVRPDALLVIAVVSNNDDCSVRLDIPLENQTEAQKAALTALLPKESWSQCQLHGDRIGANPWLNESNCQMLKSKGNVAKCPGDCSQLPAGSASRQDCDATVQKDWQKFARVDTRIATAADYAWRFKTLKVNPNQLMFVAISGDSLAKSDSTRQTDRQAFYKSALHDVAIGQAPSVCSGPGGGARFGSRYLQVAELFGENGLILNVCDRGDFGEQAHGFTEALVKLVPATGSKTCADADGDGVSDTACGGSDCNDVDPAVSPGKPEVCDNGVDDDCDGLTDHIWKTTVGSDGNTTWLDDGCVGK